MDTTPGLADTAVPGQVTPDTDTMATKKVVIMLHQVCLHYLFILINTNPQVLVF